MATLLVKRRVQVLQIHCGCGTDLKKDSQPPPSCRSSLGVCSSGGQSFGFFHVVKQLNNENRWRMPDRIDQVM